MSKFNHSISHAFAWWNDLPHSDKQLFLSTYKTKIEDTQLDTALEWFITLSKGTREELIAQYKLKPDFNYLDKHGRVTILVIYIKEN